MRDGEVYVNLRVLSQLQPGDRIRADAAYIEIEPRSALSWVKRWFRSDTREKTVARVEQLIQDALRLKVTECVLCSACAGVRVLIDSTYADDPLTVARLQTAINRVAPANRRPRLLGAKPWLSATLPAAQGPAPIGPPGPPAAQALTASCPALSRS